VKQLLFAKFPSKGYTGFNEKRTVVFMDMQNKRVAAIHDLSGVGRCSLTVIMPILSAMGVQACPVPTAILSTHTGGF